MISKLKQILAIAMVVMMAVVFMPILPGVNGEASAARSVYYDLDLRDGKGIQDDISSSDLESMIKAAEGTKESLGYTKKLAGWVLSTGNIDETDSTKLVTTAQLRVDCKYRAVWKNSETGKTVVTQPLNLNGNLEATDMLSKYGYKYEAVSGSGSTLELTLDGFTMETHDISTNSNVAMRINRNTNIKLNGNNVIYAPSTSSAATGIYAEGTENTDKVTIEKSGDAANGSLSVTTSASGSTMTGVTGIFIDGPSLDIKDVDVMASVGEQKNASPDKGNNYGIFVNSKADDALAIDGATVEAKAGNSTGCSFGILAQKQEIATDGNITVSNKAKVYANSGNATGSIDKGDSTAILTHGNLTVKDAGTEVHAQSGQSNTYSYGIRTVGDTLINGAKVTAVGGNGTNRSYGIYAKGDTSKVTINAESEVEAAAGTSTSGSSYGIIVKDGGTIALNSGNVTAKGNTSACSKIPDFAPKVDANASTSIDGTSPVNYEDDANSTYKWVNTYVAEDSVCSITKSGVTTEYSSLQKAVKATGAGDTIKITADTLTLTSNLKVQADKQFTVDLNGKSIDLNNHHIICHGQLTVNDSSEDGTGNITGGSPTTDEIKADHNNNIGGAVAITKQENTAKFTLAGGTIESCSAQDGGAVFVGEGAKFLMSGGTINDCSATLGGAVYNYRGTAIINSKICNCTATNYGGAIYNENIISGKDNSGSTTVNANAIITGCSAKDGTGKMGGGIFNKGTLRMNGGTISGCSAAKGAGVHNDGTSDKVKFELKGGEIKDNTAVENGGGIQNSANATLTINGGSITGNKATNNYGGGVFNRGILEFGNTAKITITGNKGTTSEVSSNVAFAEGTTGAVTAGDLFTGSSVGGMAVKKYNTETTYNLTENDIITNFTQAKNSFFTSDDEDYELSLDTESDKIKFQKTTVVKGTGTVTGGTVSINPETPSAGTEVTITATPDSGYEVGTITVTDKQGNSITVTDGKFTMPTNEYLLPVTISANFTKDEPSPSPSPSPSPDPSSDYTVTFDNQGHGVVPQSQKIENGGKISDPGSLTAEGYIFGGWFTDEACTKAWDFDKDTVTQNMTLYAKWTEKGSAEDFTVTADKQVFSFNGTKQTPTVTVTDAAGKTLVSGTDYTIDFEDSINVGDYTATVKGIGSYLGEKTIGYTINPAAKAVKKVVPAKKKLTVKWTKTKGDYLAQTTGFQVKVSTTKSFAKSKTKTVNVSAKKTYRVFKGLKSHKKYYVKMRAYKKISTATHTKTYYSNWSKVKVKKTK